MFDWCLITDIDGTLIGERASSERLRRAVLSERRWLAAQGRRLYWVIATGRHYQSARDVLLNEGFDLGDFDAFITSLGAELYWSGVGTPDRDYHSFLAESGFERQRVVEALRSLDFLELQPKKEQFDHKVSYFLTDTEERRRRVRAALSILPFDTHVAFSHNLHLDVAPGRGAKGGAVQHVLASFKLARARAVAAGDSGNDARMLEQEWYGIVVGNGRAALSHLRERTNIYFAELDHAAGVLEGLLALEFLAKRG